MTLEWGKKAADTKRSHHANKKLPFLVAVAGGKGGTGKSFLALQVAREFAKRGLKTIVADLDCGSSSLHHFLASDPQKSNIQGFLEGKSTEIFHQTEFENLKFTPFRERSGKSLTHSLNIKQKTKLIQAFRESEADYIVLDLGAGTHLDTVDFALFSDFVLIPLNSEETAMQNAEQFCAALFCRKIETLLAALGFPQLSLAWNKTLRNFNIENASQSPLKSFQNWLQREGSLSPEAASRLLEKIQHHLVHTHTGFVLNQARFERDIQNARVFANRTGKQFGFDSEFHGFVRFDDSIWQHIRRSQQPNFETVSVALHRDMHRFMNSLFEQVSKIELVKEHRSKLQYQRPQKVTLPSEFMGGETLRSMRKFCGMSLNEVSVRLRIKQEVLQCIEENDFEKFQAKLSKSYLDSYVFSMIKEYLKTGCFQFSEASLRNFNAEVRNFLNKRILKTSVDYRKLRKSFGRIYHSRAAI